MPLRTPNNPLYEAALLAILPPILAPSTQLASGSASGTGLELIYINAAYDLSRGTFPAVLLLADKPQTYQRNSTGSYTGQFPLAVEYYDRWDTQRSLTIDALRTNIEIDLLRMLANLENYLAQHEGFPIGGTTYPVSLTTAAISDYAQAPDSRFPGIALGVRTLTVLLHIQPYQV